MRTGKTVIGLALVAAAVLGGSSVLEASASTPAAGAIHVFSNPTHSGTSGTILIAGAIGDYGKYIASDQTGKPNPQGNYIKIVLNRGTFEINGNKLNDNHKTSDKATCSLIRSGTAPGAVLNGTGLSKGIRGTLKVTMIHALLASRYTTGSKKGHCKVGGKARPVAEYDSLSATGNVNVG